LGLGSDTIQLRMNVNRDGEFMALRFLFGMFPTLS
jgi:hypothetical protein